MREEEDVYDVKKEELVQGMENKEVVSVTVCTIHISPFSSLSWVLSLTKFFEEACKFGHQERSKSFGRALLKLRREKEGGAGLPKKRRRGGRNMHKGKHGEASEKSLLSYNEAAFFSDLNHFIGHFS